MAVKPRASIGRRLVASRSGVWKQRIDKRARKGT